MSVSDLPCDLQYLLLNALVELRRRFGEETLVTPHQVALQQGQFFQFRHVAPQLGEFLHPIVLASHLVEVETERFTAFTSVEVVVIHASQLSAPDRCDKYQHDQVYLGILVVLV